MKKNAEAEFLKAVFPADDRKLSRRRIDRAAKALGASPEPSESPRTALNRFYDNLNVPRSETASMGQNTDLQRQWKPVRAMSLAGGMLVLFVCVSLTLFGPLKHFLRKGDSEVAAEGISFEAFDDYEERSRDKNSKSSVVLPPNVLYCTDLDLEVTAEYRIPTKGADQLEAKKLLNELVEAYPESFFGGEGSFLLSFSLDEPGHEYQLRFESEAAALASDEPLAKLWKLLSKQ